MSNSKKPTKSTHCNKYTRREEALISLKTLLKKIEFNSSENYKMTEDLTIKCGSFNFEYFRYAGRERMQTFIIKRVHVKSINVTIKERTKVIHRIKDMDTFFLLLLLQTF